MQAENMKFPTLDAISSQCIETQHEANQKLCALFDKFAEEARRLEPLLSDQEKAVLVERVEAEAKRQTSAPLSQVLEQALLGAILINNQALWLIADLLEPHHFSDPIHQKLYEDVLSLARVGKVASPITVKTFLPPDIHILGRTPSQYLAWLVANAAPQNVVHQCAYIIRELALERGPEPTQKPPHILPYMPFGKYRGWRFEDINPWYLDWLVRNVHDERVLETARYHLELRYKREIETQPPAAARLQATNNDLTELFNLEIDNN